MVRPEDRSLEVEEPVARGEHAARTVSVGSVLVAECRVGDRVVFIVNDLGRPALCATDRAAVIQSLSRQEGAVVAVVGEASSGRCRLAVVPAGAHAGRVAAARAAAVVQASWAWDESPQLLVSVDEELIETTARYSEGGWFADVRAVVR